MKRTALFSILALAAALVAGASGCRGWESDKPPVHLNWNMDTQEKGKAYRKEALFADGRVMRAPVEGTVARGYLRDDDHKFLGQVDGKDAVKFPEGMKPEDLVARGANRYQIYCTPCHGRDADGKGPVATRVPSGQGGLLVPPPDLKSERVKEMLNGQIYRAMLNGVNNGNMPSYAAQIPVEDRWAIIAYIRQLQGGNFEPTGAAEVVLTAGPSADNGKALYKSKGCNACHSIDGTKVVGPTFKGLYGRTESTSAGDVAVDEAYVRESILQPMAKVVNGYPPAMPQYAAVPAAPSGANQLTEDELKSIVLFLETLK